MARYKGPSKFSKFLEDNDISVHQAARGLHVTDPTVIDWRDGKKPPSPDHRVAIRIWTKSAVVEDDWPRTKREIKQSANVALVRPFDAPEEA